eukprot:scaffold3141_cov350-Prasinococcus_capsulatus_cf.AAC.3
MLPRPSWVAVLPVPAERPTPPAAAAVVSVATTTRGCGLEALRLARREAARQARRALDYPCACSAKLNWCRSLRSLVPVKPPNSSSVWASTAHTEWCARAQGASPVSCISESPLRGLLVLSHWKQLPHASHRSTDVSCSHRSRP